MNCRLAIIPWMDSDVLRKQIVDEIQAQFETKLREVKRQKSNAEEELESSSERWRAERRRLTSEIDRLESALAEAKGPSRRKSVSEGKATGVDSQDVAKVQSAYEDKLKKVTTEWEAERSRLLSQISRLEAAVAEAIERSSNPMRSTQPIKEQFEIQLAEAARQRVTVEEELLRAKAMWDEDKKKLTGEIVKLRRLAPSKALEVRDKLDKLAGKELAEDARIRELGEKLAQAHSQAEKYHQAALKAREETRSEYEPRLEEAYRERAKVDAMLATLTKEWDGERQQLHNQLAQLQQTVVQAKSRQEQQPDLHEATAQWTKEREGLQGEVQQLQRALAETRENVSAEVVEQLRLQYDVRIHDMIQQKTQLAQQLQAASSMLETERARFANEVGMSKSAAGENAGIPFDADALNAEVQRVEAMIQTIAAMIDDPATELSTVIRKNVEKAELDAYLRGILFTLGRGKAL